jgi:formate hydrogenlyase transcriptional activator
VSDLALVAELISAIRDAHSPRALVRALAAALATRFPITRVELLATTPIAIAERAGDEWRCIAAPPTPSAQVLAPGLAVIARGYLPPAALDPQLRATLARVVDLAVQHLAVVQRVASLSRRAHDETRELRADLARRSAAETGAIVARSPAMRAAVERAVLVARHPTTVLLAGESGTGKELVARELHRRSPRAHRPLVSLNCAAIPPPLVESELFGHERGAFTGAERAHAGAFERAHHGTLFLDEIGELPAAAQATLLRVVQDGVVRRVGGEGERFVDVRLVAATHRPLAAMVSRGEFRADLYYRLAVFSIALPPLRDRAEDLGPLATALVAELAARLGVAPPPLTRAVLARLAAYDWPGNVRELRNVLESALVLGGGGALELPDLPRTRRPRGASPHLADAVRVAIEEALRATGGKLYGPGGAAERLGLPPGTLQSKMRKLGIDRAAFVGLTARA